MQLLFQNKKNGEKGVFVPSDAPGSNYLNPNITIKDIQIPDVKSSQSRHYRITEAVTANRPKTILVETDSNRKVSLPAERPASVATQLVKKVSVPANNPMAGQAGGGTATTGGTTSVSSSRRTSRQEAMSGNPTSGTSERSSTRAGGASRSHENIIGKYKLGKTIGKGNFAKVKLAKHLPSDKDVSFKI